MSKTYEIAVVPGDGIGPEVCSAALETICAAAGRRAFNLVEHPAGAGHFRTHGTALPEETFAACKTADAVLHGAAGIPGVVYPDGTEAGIEFGLQLRFRLDLYANIRPIRLHPGVESPLKNMAAGDIDYVILRENTEGLYASRGSGTNLRDEIATDTLVMTRKGIERIARKAFELARRRNGAPLDGKKRVTVCDKANVLRSYAFFRKVCEQVAEDFPDVELDYGYADAMMVHMVRRPSFYDVIVTENMFGDIISDLGAVTVGGMGMSPSAEIGDSNGFFQAAHGSAPDIAGQGIANPIGTILAGAMMLEWLGERHQDRALTEAAGRIDKAVASVLAKGEALPPDLGGKERTTAVTAAICRAMDQQATAA
ncbi:isocitrate/isopropylmalate dehydrogenase family protein [Marinivivus vitaminiproducens]|uniref:isocitrate/isopropylmalate dehydrogenase family protein n=1 Tax=Marinivivus vitaminiproducens TaxID=3035935 RepID=UPI00279E4B99|nr:isocitrate/isopropylmalate dehydrogenase family protein [Geminicoccaceae bacterium SCSIO 64248]